MKKVYIFILFYLTHSSIMHVNAKGISDFNLNQTPTYVELIDAYQLLNSTYSTCDLISFGETDSGKPLHVFILNKDQEFYPEAFKKKSVILIQNGIHPGESCGIDASLNWAKEMLASNSLPENVIIAIIPVYNIGGMLNRGCCSRANQNGPEEHGFRGNSRNLDLNRDFIKGDSKNAAAFARIFHWLNPQIFIDTHTSNGADYQYTMTLLPSRKERLDAHLSNYLITKLEPYIYENYQPLSPYVNVFGTTPNKGIHSFNDLPRFSSGYVALFNCIGLTTEAHMWKPYKDRVNATKDILQIVATFSEANFEDLVANKLMADSEGPKDFESLNLEIDTTRFDMINFLSYKPEYRYSDILGRDQLYYAKNKPQEVQIKYYNYYDKTDEIKVPRYYVIRSAWKEVISKLQSNHIEMEMMEKDTMIDGVGTYILDYDDVKSPYEGHYLHKDVQVLDSVISMPFFAGDYLVSTNQLGWKYILNVLEPKSEDSFFAWNFYDEILQQKEWYSAYVFEPYAQQMLEDDAMLQQEYDLKLETDTQFASNGRLRLYWLYTKSPFFEPDYKRLPILKIY